LRAAPGAARARQRRREPVCSRPLGAGGSGGPAMIGVLPNIRMAAAPPRCRCEPAPVQASLSSERPERRCGGGEPGKLFRRDERSCGKAQGPCRGPRDHRGPPGAPGARIEVSCATLNEPGSPR